MNKVDRLYKWNSVPNSPIQDAFARQEEYVRKEFDTRCNQVRQGLLLFCMLGFATVCGRRSACAGSLTPASTRQVVAAFWPPRGS